MLRRLHALGTKSGSDPAGHLLRSLSTRNNNNNSNGNASTAQGAADDNSSAASAGVEQRNRCLGAIGPATKGTNTSRYAFGSGTSPNRGLSGLAGTGAWTWSGSDAMNGGMGVARSLSSGPEPTSRRWVSLLRLRQTAACAGAVYQGEGNILRSEYARRLFESTKCRRGVVRVDSRLRFVVSTLFQGTWLVCGQKGACQ